MTRAAVYIRISDPRGDRDDRFGLAVQERQCREYAVRAGLNVAQVYTDAITGTTETRAGFGQLLADAEAYSDVIVYAVDRLARHPKAGYALLETLQASGLNVHTAIEGMLDLTDDAGALNFGVRIVMADAERRRIKRRLMEGKRQKVRGGQPVVPLRAYGYRDGEVYEPEAQWVRWLYREALTTGTHGLRDGLIRHGVPTRGGAAWDRDAIRKLLRNSVYRGEYVYGRDRVTRQPREDAISCPAPRIVEDDLWHAVQRAMDYRSTGAGRRGSRRDLWALTGRIRCGECGAAMIGKQSSGARRLDGGRQRNYYYACGDRNLATSRGCTHRQYYAAPDVHEAVWAALRALAADPATLAAAQPAQVQPRLDVGAGVRELDKQLEKARSAYLRGIDTEDEYAATKTELNGRRAALLAAQQTILAPRDPATALRALTDALTLDDLSDVTGRLSVLVLVQPGGELELTIDPA